MATLELTQGFVVVVDDEDMPLLSRYQWYAHCLRGYWYAHTNTDSGGKRRTLSMHRLLAEAPADVLVDHRDGDTLNNRRSNLRVCSRGQNKMNAAPHKNHVGCFKGTHWRARRGGYWEARITVDGRRRHLGTFHTEEEAARAYDAAAHQHFGQFAKCNFPEEIR